MRSTTAFLFILLLASCSTSAPDRSSGPYDRPSGSESSREGMRPARMAGGGLDFLPPSEWWRKDEISRTVGLSTDQMASLDALHSQSDDIDRIQRDLVTALRDVRTTLEGEHPTSDDILTAGRRYQTLRDDLLTRQLQLLVAERSILTQQQWATLEAQMRSTARPQERRGRQGDYGGGGRRGGGMGGRRPGWPG